MNLMEIKMQNQKHLLLQAVGNEDRTRLMPHLFHVINEGYFYLKVLL